MPEETKHALLGASSAGRWMACPPSARLESLFPEETSEYAAEGTKAHALADEWINLSQEERAKRNWSQEEQEMLSTLQPYITFIESTMNDLEEEMPLLLTETLVHFDKWVPEGFGTADALIFTEDRLAVVDLKYGAGTPVMAEDNPQLRLYALGALQEFGELYDFEKITMAIIQPRSLTGPTFSRVDTTVQKLESWAEQTIKPAAKKAWAGQGEYKAGSHCRYCKAREVCRERLGHFANIIALQNARPDALASTGELAKVLREKKEVEKWLKDLEAYALREMQAGARFEGLKLVSGRRATDMIGDEQELAARMKAEGVDDALLYKPRAMVSRTELKKLVDKKTWAEIEKDFYQTRPGAPKIDKAESRAAEWTPENTNDFDGLDMAAFNE